MLSDPGACERVPSEASSGEQFEAVELAVVVVVFVKDVGGVEVERRGGVEVGGRLVASVDQSSLCRWRRRGVVVDCNRTVTTKPHRMGLNQVEEVKYMKYGTAMLFVSCSIKKEIQKEFCELVHFILDTLEREFPMYARVWIARSNVPPSAIHPSLQAARHLLSS